MTGCRIGNHIQEAEVIDSYSGYYLTEIKELTFTATTTQSVRAPSPVSNVPSDLSSVLTNPVAIILQDSASGRANIESKDGKQTLPTTISKDFTLFMDGSSSSKTLWEDPSCQTYLELQELGQIIKSNDPLSLQGNSLPLSGRIQLKVQITNVIHGNCTATLQTLLNCYQDANHCGADSTADNESIQSGLIAFFKPWIDSQAFLPTEIPNLISYGYEAVYE